jgi:Spy/CpxP family protein refolding chaperone
MRFRGLLTFAVLLVAAAVGLAMTSVTNASGWRPVSHDDQAASSGRPQGPPPGPRGGGPGGGGPGGGGPGGGGLGRMLFDMDLTAAQLEQVKGLMQADREASAPYHETLRDINDQMRQAVESGEFSEETVRALAAKEAAATIELRVIGAKTQAAIYKLLTAEQKKALADARDDQPPPRPRRGKSPAFVEDPLVKGGA